MASAARRGAEAGAPGQSRPDGLPVQAGMPYREADGRIAGKGADAEPIAEPIEAAAADPDPARANAAAAQPTEAAGADGAIREAQPAADPDPDPDTGPSPEPEPGRPIDEAELDRICLHNLLSACADMIYFKDRDSRFLRVSDSAAAFGGTDPAAMIGKTVLDYFTPEHAAAAFATEQMIMATGQAITDFEEPHLQIGRAHV